MTCESNILKRKRTNETINTSIIYSRDTKRRDSSNKKGREKERERERKREREREKEKEK